MKLSQTEKIIHRDRVEQLLDLGGTMGSYPECKFTVVAVPANTFDADFSDDSETKFFYVAASYCSPVEKFRRKRGELVALERLFNNEFMIVPAMGRSADDVLTDTMEFLMEV